MTDPKANDSGGRSTARARRYVHSRVTSGFAKSLSVLWTAEAVALASGAIEALALARLLRPAQLGTLTLAVSVPAFIFAIVDAQSQEAVTRYIAEFREASRLDRVRSVVALAVKVDLALVVLGIGVTAALSPWIVGVFLDHDLAAYLLVIAALGVATGLPASTARAILMADERAGAVAASRTITAVLEAVSVTIIVWAGGGVSGAILATAASAIIGLGVVAWLASSSMRRSFGGLWEPPRSLGSERGRVIRFIAFTNGSSLVATLAKDMDVLVLGYLTGTRQVGFYRVARSVSRISTFLIAPLQALTYNRFAVLVASGDLRSLRRQVKRSLREVGLPLALGIVVVMLFAPQLVRLAATNTYAPATGPLRWLLAAGAFLTATFWARPLLLALEQVRFLLVATVVTTAIAVPLYFILTSYADAAGTASARALATGLCGTGASALWGWRVLRARMARAEASPPRSTATARSELPHV